ncbi:FAD-dependent oxidoreductase [Actinoplanes sp. NPDC051633]|uniref:NAD(P)/FAD-dependent oxidoreductase n=1 Tax=Actinoplanes sp. NPDC051633 TaxID=3155670 RepID=UPI00341FF23E
MADVIVVGGGIIGLTAAVRLQEAGLDVVVWSKDPPERTVSSVSAAVWYPTRTEFDPRVRAWGLETYDEFTRQAAAGIPGLLIRTTRNVGKVDSLWWAPPGLSRDEEEVSFAAPLAEMSVYLPWLAARVRVERREVRALGEVPAPVVVNATGLAARELAGDPAVYPARGQIVLVRNPGVEESVRAQGFYVHPRSSDVVLGGTWDENEWDLAPDPAVRSRILAGTAELVPALEGAEVLGDRVGLRPCRRGGPRVEREGRVVHAYGHGGAGMTLSWGCATEITRLVVEKVS